MMDAFDNLLAIVGVLDDAGVSYALCGGWAVAVHGFVRATEDIDLLILSRDIEAAKEAVRTIGFKFPAAAMTFEAGTPRARVLHRVSKVEGEETLTLDLLQVDSPEDEVWTSRQTFEFEGRRVTAVSREGLARMKRLAGRPKDLLDLDALNLSRE